MCGRGACRDHDRHESRLVKEGPHEKNVRHASCVEPAVKRATRAGLEAWGGTGLVVLASVMMKFSVYSVLRTVAFVAAILVATGLIVRSLRDGRDDEQ